MNVKICDLKSNSFGDDFKKSLIETGFAVLTNHDIDHGEIKESQEAWREFFLSDLENKEHFVNKNNPNLGYKAFKSEKAVGASKADLKEFYHWAPGGGKLPNGLRDITANMFGKLEVIGLNALQVLDSKYSNWCFESDSTILRTLYYPAMDFAAEAGSVRAAAHEDINLITLLIAASSAGLQVKDVKGNWHDVPHQENSIVVNVGDMLQLASKGFYKSTTHRVINPSDSKSDRISMPLFVHPNSDILLADNFTAGQYLAERIAQITQATK